MSQLEALKSRKLSDCRYSHRHLPVIFTFRIQFESKKLQKIQGFFSVLESATVKRMFQQNPSYYTLSAK